MGVAVPDVNLHAGLREFVRMRRTVLLVCKIDRRKLTVLYSRKICFASNRMTKYQGLLAKTIFCSRVRRYEFWQVPLGMMARPTFIAEHTTYEMS